MKIESMNWWMAAAAGEATTLSKRLLDALYPDQERPYREALMGVAGSDTRALEIGAGSGVGMQFHSPLQGVVGYFVGIDLEPAVGTSPDHS